MMSHDDGKEVKAQKPEGPLYEQFWNEYVHGWEKRVDKIQKQEKSQDTPGEVWLRLAMEKGQLSFPGDEWGTKEHWKQLFMQLFVQQGVEQWKHSFEIGSGSGKFTDLVWNANADVKICCLDVAPNFLEIVKTRFQPRLGQTLYTFHIVQSASDFPLEDAFTQLGWPLLDAVYSIDAMVHVDLQYLISYFVSASRILKPGGKLIMTLADCTSPTGFEKLIRDTRQFFKIAGQQCPKFEWLCPEAVNFIMAQLGFKVVFLQSPGRDQWLVAELVEPNKAIDALL
jgi:SAM-dependent methyltransferase